MVDTSISGLGPLLDIVRPIADSHLYQLWHGALAATRSGSS